MKEQLMNTTSHPTLMATAERVLPSEKMPFVPVVIDWSQVLLRRMQEERGAWLARHVAIMRG